MAQAVVSGIIKKMCDLLVQEAAFLYGVSDQIELIKLQLHQMQCFLKDADSAQKKDERVKGWVKDIRDVAYETEDAIDIFLGEIALSQRKGVGIGGLRLFAQKPAELVARHKLGEKMSKIQTKLSIISEGRTTFGIENLGEDHRSETKSIIRVAMNPDNDDFDIVGFEDAKTNLIQQLVAAGSEQRRRVVSIVGQGGLGKTTLAQKIYSDKTIKEYFDVTLWLTISSDFKIADILKKAIQKLLGSTSVVNKDQENDVEFLLEEMKHVLGSKRYFIVLDDVWTKDFFVLFERAIPDACSGSRVLMTSRSLEVAKLADPSSMPYELRFLNDDESLKLLLRKAFPYQNETSGCCIGDDHLVDVAKQITKLCGGLPLALVVVGGLLSVRNPTYDGWNRVLRTINWQSDGTECMEILAMSYRDLTQPLKLCFLFLACFPEDYEIHKGPLMRMWIAEGFIQHDGRGEMEDEAEHYLEELAQRCMVRVTKRYVKCGTIKSIRVHDLLRELAISESKEQKFLQVNPKQNHGPHTTSRRAAYFQTDMVTCNNNNNNLRSLLIFDVPAPNPIRFGLLRLLELRNVGTVEKLPAAVTNMVHLRYLGFRGSSVCSLPEKIDRLQNLQTLDIRATPLTSIPVSLWDITTLRHVHTDWFRPVNGPPKGCKLESILTLKYTKVMAWEDGLPQLKNIRKLGILNIDNRNPIPTTQLLTSLEHLRNLTVGFGPSGTLPEEIVDMRHFRSYSNIQYLTLAGEWPQSMPFSAATLPVHITQLVLHNSRLEQDPMPELKKLKSMKVLYLISNAICCNKITCMAGGFPQLEKLCVMIHNSLEEWHVEEGSLPFLRYLYIQECSELRILPDLHHVTTLQELEMRSMPKQLLSRLAQPGGEDWHKINHVPSIQY